MKIARVGEMRGLDRTAVEEYGIKEELLMENAGEAVYSVILKEVGIEGLKFAVFCGIGNNGGDGLVVARKILSMGGEVEVFLLGNPEKFKGAARTNFRIAERLPLSMSRIESMAPVRRRLETFDVVIDALFGTGLVREVGGVFKEAVDLINRSRKPVFSVDIPSGIHGDTGQVMGAAVYADATVTFGLPKPGHLLYPGAVFGGDLYVTHISFPPELTDKETLLIETNDPVRLPDRPEDGHKGTFGDVLFIAGSANYFGAPFFAAMSFLKAGGGYSRLATPASVTPFIGGKGSELVYVPLQETESGSIALSERDKLLSLADQTDMVVLGPGLSLDEETQELARQLAARIRKPLLIDGDGLTALSAQTDILKKRKAPTVLTPHLGEMAKLSGLSIDGIREDRIGILQTQARELGAHVVLKGAHSLIGHPDRRIFVNLSGNSGLATAGSGDVLTGTIAAMYGLGIPLPDAVRNGVFLHGLAGDLAADEIGEDGVTAQDILDNLPLSVRLLREEYEDVVEDACGYIRAL